MEYRITQLGVHMEFDEFIAAIQNSIAPGSEFENPGEGTSLIKSVTDQRISYKRENSTISVTFEALFAAYDRFQGRLVTASDLKVFFTSCF